MNLGLQLYFFCFFIMHKPFRKTSSTLPVLKQNKSDLYQSIITIDLYFQIIINFHQIQSLISIWFIKLHIHKIIQIHSYIKLYIDKILFISNQISYCYILINIWLNFILINKIIQQMTENPVVENVSLLKESSFKNQTIKELKHQLKKKESLVHQIEEAVTNHRIKIRKLSDSVTKIIQRKMNKVTTERPSLYPAKTQTALKLYQQRDSLHNQIQQIKLKIHQVKAKEEPQITAEILRIQPELDKINSIIKQTKQEQAFLKGEIDNNKNRLQQLQKSTCLRDLKQYETELQNLKKQIKSKQKEYYSVFNEQVSSNMYYFELKDSVELKQEINKAIQPKVQERQISKAINQLNNILEEKKKNEQKHGLIIALKNKQIQTMIYENKHIEKMIRNLQHNELKNDLEERRFKSEKKSNKKQQPNKKQNPIKHNFSVMLQKKIIEVQEKVGKDKRINQILNRSYENHTIILGNWQLDQNCQILNDSQLLNKNNSITEVLSINFIINSKNNHILGLVANYNDNHKNPEGQRMVSNPQNQSSSITIKLNEVTGLQYCSKTQHSKNINFLKWVKQYQKQIVGVVGECDCDQKNIKKIDLKDNTIKFIQVLLNKESQSSYIKGMKIGLVSRPIEQHINQQDESLKHQQTSRSYSLVNIGIKKKILRGGTLKKINESQHQIDYRLLINRKKLV